MIKIIIDMLSPSKVVAIGNDAYKCLVQLSDDHVIMKVRHPSYGGEKMFAKQMTDISRCWPTNIIDGLVIMCTKAK